MSSAWGPGNATEEELLRLMDTYGGMLFSLCRMMLRDHHRAQDAVQETFIKAYKHIEYLPQLKNEKAWLIRIAVNICRDTMRTAWFRHVIRSVDIAELPEVAAPQPADTDDSPLLEMVQSLSPKEREVLLLYYWQSLTPEEISSTLRINRATVYRRLEKARSNLKITLEGGLPHD